MSIYLSIYLPVHVVRQEMEAGQYPVRDGFRARALARSQAPNFGGWWTSGVTANLRTKILDFTGFDSSRI